jgi:predicted molibdopterin-dependent oxidoreductase YjgC
VEVSDHVLPGELFMPFHYAEAAVNKLTRDELGSLFKIAPFKLSAVRVEKVDPATYKDNCHLINYCSK